MADIRFPASDGIQLAGDLRFPEDDDGHGGVAVVCHPHPSFGGSMDSWMLPVLQSALVAEGWVTLRFDFRGVGASDGQHGTGEVADVAGAVERVLEHGDRHLLLVGWSYGAAVSLRHALDDERVDGWVGIGLPVATDAVDVGLLDRLAGWSTAKLFVHGSGDRVTPLDDIEGVFEDAADPKALTAIAGGDHFLMAHADELTRAVTDFSRRLRGVGDGEDED